MSNEMNTQEEKKVLTQKDLNKAMFRWYMSAEMPLNFENMQGIAFCGSISHILKKLYTKKEDLSEALKRHLLLYNCNVTAGGLILGTTIAMEEQRAKDPSKMPDMAITGLKTGLMGPVAALGVSFDWGNHRNIDEDSSSNTCGSRKSTGISRIITVRWILYW